MKWAPRLKYGMSKRIIPPIEHTSVRLRLLEEADLPLTLRWRNQDHIRRWFFFSDVISPEQHAAWFAKYAGRDDDYVFVIEEIAAQYRPVGQVSIYHIDWAAGAAEFGRLMIGEAAAAGKGLARAATEAALLVAFDVLELQSVYLEVVPDNHRAISIYQTAGFVTVEQNAQAVKMVIQRPGAAS